MSAPNPEEEAARENGPGARSIASRMGFAVSRVLLSHPAQWLLSTNDWRERGRLKS